MFSECSKCEAELCESTCNFFRNVWSEIRLSVVFSEGHLSYPVVKFAFVICEIYPWAGGECLS